MCAAKVDNIKSSKNELDSEITILYDKIEKDQSQASEVLPDWIINCVKVDNSIKKSKIDCETLKISKELKTVLKKNDFKKLFPVQSTVIPAIIKEWSAINLFLPHDVCVCAPTGSGKTLAYAIPILQLLFQSSKLSNAPRAIVIVPTKDLASQVLTVFEKLSRDIGIRCVLIAGYKNITKERDDLLDPSGTDVIICTPGRLVEHIKNTDEFDLSCIRHLVIDEADRVIEDMKHDWYLTLARHMGLKKRFKNIQACFVQPDTPIIQKILLSATLTRKPHLLEHFDLHWPKLFVIGGKPTKADQPTTGNVLENYGAPLGLKEFFVTCDEEYLKIIFIVDQIRRLKMSHILCFTNTRECAIRLDQLLNQFDKVRSAHLHCQLAPDRRQKLRKNFENGSIDVLITVDSMARGMDIANVRCVIQYDVQIDVCTYVHRVGRTARAGQSGCAYAIVSSKQVYHLKKNLTNCGRDIKNHKFCKAKSYKYLTEFNAGLKKLQNKPEDIQEETMDE